MNNTQTVEDQNDKLQEQLDEIRARTAILDAESAQGRTINDGLQSKLSGLEAEIATLREQAILALTTPKHATAHDALHANSCSSPLTLLAAVST